MSKISIVIPVYWNADTLGMLYDDLEKKVLPKLEDYEIVFVDDGSGDSSWKVINEIKEKDDRVVAVKLSRNFGEHAAILAGLSVCTGDCAVTKQADLQEDSLLILDMYESWKKGNKVVLAAREDRADTFFTKLFAGMYYKLVRKYITERMPEGGCDCYLVDRQVIKTLLDLDEMNSSLTLQVLWVGYQTDIIYYHRLEREVGEGRWTFSKKFKLMLDSFISFTYLPIRLMWGVGIVFFIFAVIMGISVFVEYFTKGTPVAGWASLMCILLMSSGLILWMLGFLGEYIWRTFDASRNRPPFIIDEVRTNNKKEG
ncbi:MAG: glycosyltransferase family 2 protein [Lachnospiraceae bacterium]|nr:glycosyltransferase family 2 protein [Lachnospiraceae bacterium]